MEFERSAEEIYSSKEELIVADIFEQKNHENSMMSYSFFVKNKKLLSIIFDSILNNLNICYIFHII